VLVTDSKFNNPAAKSNVSEKLMGNAGKQGYDFEGNMNVA
jgi:hypothetical protein